MSEEKLGEKDNWEFYKSTKDGDWYWKRTAANGQIVGRSHEGYKKKSDCLANAEREGYVSWEDGE